MLVQERYNNIIETVENSVTSRRADAWEEPIDIEKLSHEAFENGECDYLDGRSKSEVFKFLTGLTFKQYVNQRLMMHTYNVLLEQKEYNAEELINITGVSSESSLYKKFKETFSLSPKEAYELKIQQKYIKPAYWDTLSSTSQDKFIQIVEVVKEVPVEVVKLDRRPFKIAVVIAGILILAVAAVGYYQNLKSIWCGEYVIFDNMYEETTDITHLVKDINPVSDTELVPSKMTIELPDSIIRSEVYSNYRIKIKSVTLDTIKLYFQGAFPYEAVGKMQEDGTIILTGTDVETGNQLWTHKLININDYDEWKKIWDGIYEMSSGTEAIDSIIYSVPVYNSGIAIYVDKGVLILGTMDGTETITTAGLITDFNGEYLDFCFQGDTTKTICRCVSEGEAGFSFDMSFLAEDWETGGEDVKLVYSCKKTGSWDEGILNEDWDINRDVTAYR